MELNLLFWVYITESKFYCGELFLNNPHHFRSWASSRAYLGEWWRGL